MKRVVGIIAPALLLTAVAEGTAWAGPLRLRIEDVTAGTGVTLTDNNLGDANAATGAVVYIGAVSPNFSINVTTGTSAPLIGGLTDFGQISLTSVSLATTGGGTLRITLENSDFVGPIGALEAAAVLSGFLAAPAGSSLQAQSWANGGNVASAFGPDTLVASPMAPIGGVPAGSVPLWAVMPSIAPGALSSQSSTVFDNGAVSTFALFTQLTITFSGAGSITVNSNVRAVPADVPPVPEPTSLLLLGTGLSACGLIRSRKRSRTQS